MSAKWKRSAGTEITAETEQIKRNIEIIATLKPDQITADFLREMVDSGMSIIRFNASHCTPEDLIPALELIRVSASDPMPALMLDLPGTEYRVYGYDEVLPLQTGERIRIFASGADHPEAGLISSYADFSSFEPGCQALFMNGEIRAEAVLVHSDSIVIEILNAGSLRPNAHFWLQSQYYKCVDLPETDKKWINFSLDQRMQYLALSMIQVPAQIDQVREHIGKRMNAIKLVAKFETRSSLKHIDAIVERADAVFVARDDLGSQIPVEAIPQVQKFIISRCNQHGKPVFVATQMLSSMMEKPIPTRAEISDIANAVLEGADGITLSEETALGRFPLQSVRSAREIIRHCF
ncbi:MAG: pyruvate kinase, partial [Candidatus Cloacimonadaceae bacterium]|nr:pyruvate kinase [Candidatus Cloacimonadaceae bacterium]